VTSTYNFIKILLTSFSPVLLSFLSFHFFSFLYSFLFYFLLFSFLSCFFNILFTSTSQLLNSIIRNLIQILSLSNSILSLLSYTDIAAVTNKCTVRITISCFEISCQNNVNESTSANMYDLAFGCDPNNNYRRNGGDTYLWGSKCTPLCLSTDLSAHTPGWQKWPQQRPPLGPRVVHPPAL
jgi:hypothetical protein